METLGASGEESGMSRNYGLLLVLMLALAILTAAAAPTPPGEAPLPSVGGPRAAAIAPEFMGMAIRDPWYEFNTNPEFPNAPNQAFQDEMGANLERAGVRWVRLEFHIPVGLTSTEAISAEIAKNDYFIYQVAPRHNFKVLALLGFGLLRGAEATLLNTSPIVTSKYGGGVNQYMHTWLERALMIADHYRDSIAAYEILNEQNRLPPDGAAIQPVIMARLLTKFYRFCKNIEPSNENHGCSNAKIILGGIHPRGTSSPSMITDADYVRRTYDITNSLSAPSPFNDFKSRHPGLGYPVDGIAYHPYPEEIRLSPNN